MRLNELPQRKPAWVDRIDWSRMTPAEGQRLREFGICEGASVEFLHRGGLFGGGAIACRVGRMTIAMRGNHAAAITVRTSAETNAAAQSIAPREAGRDVALAS